MARKTTRKGAWGIVYVLQTSSSPEIKIGSVESLEMEAVHRRVKRINASNPGKTTVDVKSCMRVFGSVKEVEFAIHKLFDAERTQGEWFEVPPERMEALFNIVSYHAAIVNEGNREKRAIHVVGDLRNLADELTRRGRRNKLPGFCQKCGKMAKQRKDGKFQRLCESCAADEAAQTRRRKKKA